MVELGDQIGGGRFGVVELAAMGAPDPFAESGYDIFYFVQIENLTT